MRGPSHDRKVLWLVNGTVVGEWYCGWRMVLWLANGTVVGEWYGGQKEQR